ncbi:MAG TPA: DMT family transporter [Candidatus Acidoferrales bacterium]|nr:DMT family transporter [Candidatus Acidoferrales bacterium]
MGVFLGLAAALSWGTADFIAQFSARRIGAYRTLFFMQVAGFLSGVLYVISRARGSGLSAMFADLASHWELTLFMGGASGLSMLAFYSALERGTISIVAPISSSYPALTVLLAYGSGERLTSIRLAGVVCALSGVMLASLAENTPKSATEMASAREAPRWARQLAPGVIPAILCALGFGVTYWALGFRAIPAWGAVNTVLIQRLSTVVWLTAAVTPLGRSLAPPAGSGWLLIAVVGVLDAFGFLLSNYGFEREQVGVITVLGSMFGAVTLVLAFIFLGERLARRQWFGVGLIFAGILLINSR